MKRKSLALVFFQKGHIYDQVAFHSNLNAVLNLPHVGTEWMSVASLPQDISRSNILLISPHLFSVIVENWLSRGRLRQRSVIIRRRSHTLLEQALPEFPPLILASPVLWRAYQYFTFIFMCVIWKMLFQLWSISANCLKCLHRLQPWLVEMPGIRLSYWRSACILHGTVHYFNLLAFCIKPQKHCHWQLIWCKFLSCLLGFLFRQ